MISLPIAAVSGILRCVAYALSFGRDFFWNAEYDAMSSHVATKRPTSIEEAVSQLSDETWDRIAREVFDCEPEYLNIETVLAKIEETNTCLNLDPPVKVCIDLCVSAQNCPANDSAGRLKMLFVNGLR